MLAVSAAAALARPAWAGPSVTILVGGKAGSHVDALARAFVPFLTRHLPDTAIATDQSRKIVFVVKEDNTVEAKPVVLGPLDEGLRVVREGLKAEDRVIVDGIQRARVGAKVAPHPMAAGSKP